ncbi:MAG: T9SS type A sorting domain-containing protein [Saprospiraceae bacterium]
MVGSSCDSLYRVDLSKSFLVSPNPVREYLHIEFLYEYPFRINYEFELLNLQGVRTFYKELDNATRTYQVPTEQLPDGMYLYRIVSEGVTYQSGKIFKG